MELPNKKYGTLYIDPAWEQELVGKFKTRFQRSQELPYDTMSYEKIANLPLKSLCLPETHIWLWTSNQWVKKSLKLLEDWDFNYLCMVTWVKPSGVGAWFANTTQHLLFAYNEKCVFPKNRYRPTHIITGLPKKHSQKPKEFYKLIEGISPEPRLELFARDRRQGWDAWGLEVPLDTQNLLSHCV